MEVVPEVDPLRTSDPALDPALPSVTEFGRESVAVPPRAKGPPPETWI